MIRPLSTFSLSLTEVAGILGVEFESEIKITGVTNKDSEAIAGDLFLAMPGENAHGAS